MASFYPSLSIALSPSFILPNFSISPPLAPSNSLPSCQIICSPLFISLFSLFLSFTHSIPPSLSPTQFLPLFLPLNFSLNISLTQSDSTWNTQIVKPVARFVEIWWKTKRRKSGFLTIVPSFFVGKNRAVKPWRLLMWFWRKRRREKRRRWRPYYFHSLLCVWSSPTSFHPKMISFSLSSSSLSPPPSLSPSLPPPPYSLPFLLSLVLSTSGCIKHNGIQHAGK